MQNLNHVSLTVVIRYIEHGHCLFGKQELSVANQDRGRRVLPDDVAADVDCRGGSFASSRLCSIESWVSGVSFYRNQKSWMGIVALCYVVRAIDHGIYGV